MRLHYRSEHAEYWQGDARDLDAIADGSVQLIVTSPPYFNAKTEYASWPTYDAYLADMLLAWRECYRVLCDGGRIAVNVPMGYDRPSLPGGYKPIGAHTTLALQAASFELRGHIIWAKMGLANQNNGTAWGSWQSASDPSLRDGHEEIIIAHKGKSGRGPGQDDITRDEFLEWTRSVWTIKPVSASWHPAPFPAEIPRRLMKLYSFVGDTVLDPFVGSGTTVFTAEANGRRGIGVDLCQEYLTQSVGPLLTLEGASCPSL